MNYKITPEDAVLVGNRVYFTINEFNGLFYSDYGEENAHLATVIPGESIDGIRLYSSLQYVNKKYICLIPFKADGIGIYDVELHEIYKVDLPSEVRSANTKFMASAVVDNDIFVFELNGTSIYKINVLEKKCEKICSWGNVIGGESFFDKNDAFFRYQTQVYNEKIYVPFCNANAILIYDYYVNSCDIKVLGKDNNGYAGIQIQNDNVFCGPRRGNGYGVVWNMRDDKLRRIDVVDGDIVGIHVKDGECFFALDKDYSFLRNDNELVYDRNKNLIRLLDENRIWNVNIDTESIEAELCNGNLDRSCFCKPVIESGWLGIKSLLSIV